MQRLIGRHILVAEDNPIVGLDLRQALEDAGAHVLGAANVREAMVHVEHPDLSAAVLDFGLGEETAKPVCERLAQRSVPYLLYTGYNEVDGECRNGTILHKPANTDEVLGTLAALLA